MKRLLIVSLLMTNIVMYPITEKFAKITTALVLATGTGIAGCNGKDFMPFFGASVIATVATYKYLSSFTPRVRLNQAKNLLESCAANELVRIPFKNSDDKKDSQIFFDTLHRKYSIEKLPLIGAANELEVSIVSVKYANNLIDQANKDINVENDKELHELSFNLWKTYFAYKNNTEEALALIKNHEKYTKQLKLYNKLDTTQRQTAAKEKIADAQTIKARAQNKTADSQESFVFLEWLKWFLSIWLKK